MELNSNNKLMVVASRSNIAPQRLGASFLMAGYEVCIDRGENERRSRVQVVEGRYSRKAHAQVRDRRPFSRDCTFCRQPDFFSFIGIQKRKRLKVHARNQQIAVWNS